MKTLLKMVVILLGLCAIVYMVWFNTRNRIHYILVDAK